MPDLYPSFPRKDYRISRALRLLVFSVVTTTLFISLLIVTIQFAWDGVVAPQFHQAPYTVRVEFVLPTILLVTFVVWKLLWDAAEGRVPGRRPKGGVKST